MNVGWRNFREKVGLKLSKEDVGRPYLGGGLGREELELSRQESKGSGLQSEHAHFINSYQLQGQVLEIQKEMRQGHCPGETYRSKANTCPMGLLGRKPRKVGCSGGVRY